MIFALALPPERKDILAYSFKTLQSLISQHGNFDFLDVKEI